MTPKLGESIENISSLEPSQLAWSTQFKTSIENISYEIVFENENLEPWKLIKKVITYNKILIIDDQKFNEINTWSLTNNELHQLFKDKMNLFY